NGGRLRLGTTAGFKSESPAGFVGIRRPQRLLDTVQEALKTAGWPDAQVHSEVFQAILDENFKPEPFDARIASTGAVLHVPADRSLLQVLREHGLATASSCELGVCGTCTCGYRDGAVIHRDVVLPVAKRQDRMTPCVSRARVSVTLDL
ncbi:MAG: 2Fe-2S iron-sulfur cluster binding domain-containing protein, partial [Methylobacterium sp.]|uniref:2Fe-2S iron-sulfur cluster-binding protein n=1 Tax=Methylobacterium sp. TaxID=409 RepID=UPI0025CD88DD